MICVVSSVPSLIYIELTQDILYEEYVDQMILKIRTFKCSSKIPEKLSLAISIFNFIVDFFVPLVIIIVISIVIFCQSRRTSTSVIYQKKLQSLRLLVALLYFVAYAAHWFAVARVFIGVPTPEESVLFGDFAILFPYTLPAIIWLPLSFLSSVAAAQARFYDVSISSRTIDGNSDPTSTARFAKQKREKRWSASDVLTKLERNGQPGKSDISTVVSENVSNISNTLLVINKEYRSCADQEVLEISENTFREQYLKVP
uniref:G-protein coupled receptors family 1 profile domain-containing protein n=1 Tax=Panagrolaimus sp. JU765 TaxID=591449 RepID=A0AC34QK61_9BILA